MGGVVLTSTYFTPSIDAEPPLTCVSGFVTGYLGEAAARQPRSLRGFSKTGRAMLTNTQGWKTAPRILFVTPPFLVVQPAFELRETWCALVWRFSSESYVLHWAPMAGLRSALLTTREQHLRSTSKTSELWEAV